MCLETIDLDKFIAFYCQENESWNLKSRTETIHVEGRLRHTTWFENFDPHLMLK